MLSLFWDASTEILKDDSNLNPHPFQSGGATCICQLTSMHEPVIGNILQTLSIRTKELFCASWNSGTGPIQVAFNEHIDY